MTQTKLTLQQRLVQAQLEKAGVPADEISRAIAATPARVEFAGANSWGEKRYKVIFHDGSEVETVNPSHYGGLSLNCKL